MLTFRKLTSQACSYIAQPFKLATTKVTLLGTLFQAHLIRHPSLTHQLSSSLLQGSSHQARFTKLVSSSLFSYASKDITTLMP